MCYFLTIGVPHGYEEALIAAVPRRGYQLVEVKNTSVLHALPAAFTTFALLTGGCSCELYRQRPIPGKDAEEIRRKYRKRRWPRAKIERAVSQSLAHSKEVQPFVGLRPDVISILFTAVGQARRVAVLVHFYDGGIETEQVPLRLEERPIESLMADGWIAEDVLTFVSQ